MYFNIDFHGTLSKKIYIGVAGTDAMDSASALGAVLKCREEA